MTSGNWCRACPVTTKANAALLAPVQRIEADHGVAIGQVALAWMQQRAEVHRMTVVPIPGPAMFTTVP
jgi:aryl-alcohol dehydrogenase-like predicted oxidoreductase